MAYHDWDSTTRHGYGDAYDDSWDDSWDDKPTPEYLRSKREYEDEARQWARDYE